jgi:hypothetical protein
MEVLIEKKEYAEDILTHYKTTREHLKDFIKWKFQRDDLEVDKIDYSFIADFEYYIKKRFVSNHITKLRHLFLSVSALLPDRIQFYIYKVKTK